MVAFNFSVATDMVEDGIKRQTIRPGAVRSGVGVGVMLQLYVGQRTKGCRKLRPDEVCSGFVHAEISAVGGFFTLGPAWRDLRLPARDNSVISADMCRYKMETLLPYTRDFALLDGFATEEMFFNFFPGGLSGYLYQWDVPVMARDAATWFYVYRERDGITPTFVAPSGRGYFVIPSELGYHRGACGLMRGIPADWKIALSDCHKLKSAARAIAAARGESDMNAFWRAVGDVESAVETNG